MLNAKRFGQAFVDRVANPNDILQFHKRKLVTAPKEKDHGGCVHGKGLGNRQMRKQFYEDIFSNSS
jgi:hypothetical protein